MYICVQVLCNTLTFSTQLSDLIKKHLTDALNKLTNMFYNKQPSEVNTTKTLIK